LGESIFCHAHPTGQVISSVSIDNNYSEQNKDNMESLGA